MAGSRLPRQLFLQGVAAVFMFAFASLYTQIPGLYGPEGILPARRTLRPQGKGRWQQLWETPTLLWEAPRLGLDTAQGLELLSLLGALVALGALLLSPLRHPVIYLLLWAAYLSACQVGQVFLYFQWDSLLLETGFLAVLVAPLRPASHRKEAPQGRQAGALPHEDLPFWLVRWLLFRLMFASGVVKLTSRCPAWWGLTALTYHYETQCLPTPAAWFAHHLPVWLHKLSVVATFLIEIAVPPLFFAPIRRLRLAAFYSQVLLQVLIIITGNYNFFNLMTLVLTTALLDDQHLAAEPGHGSRKKTATSWPKALLATLSLLLELAVYGLLAYGTVHYFGLEVDWQQRTIHSRTTFTFHQFSQWLKTLTLPTVWLGVASLVWELLSALWRWTQVRDWQMWFAALGPHTHSPWFTSLVLRLLQGKEPVIRLVQSQVARYPFHKQPPTYVRAQRYKYWFSQPGEQGQWWRRQWVEEFFPSVSLGDPTLETLLRQFGLQEKSPPRTRSANSTLAQALHWTRSQLSPLEAPALLWGLLMAVGAVRFVQALLAPCSLRSSPLAPVSGEKRRPASQKDSGAASEQATAAPNPCSSSSRTTRRKK
uniref:Isoform 3 of Lipase maturation factor 2 n=1 Tax=Homo sapiens TaxID=9606 RepID=Q9BU23-3